ncbi:cytochrome P450 [Nocardiopsis algeriensis]|uniref:Cytochrome P450 n=1 Tax=Nocardiopsis algeriensis TaxID=1478215 RepID=A0A841IT18_9ACTN|nr:cytochrome P450 [Nocardiopsis algeriensis]MBB6121302.1 cytochrome P450 [Nocardiopsis algeriensis]
MRTEHRTRRAGAADTARLLGTVVAPVLARGVILRRPLPTRLTAWADTDGLLVSTLRNLRERHGPDPLPVDLPGRRFAVVLSAQDVGRILEQTPEPFSAAGTEKRGALAHFQPHGLLPSDPKDRAGRREANERALVPGQAIHPHGDVIAAQADQEASALALALRREGVDLTWKRYTASYNALARRLVFGAGAAQDRRTDSLLRHLRSRANWSYLAPVDRSARAELLERLRANIASAEPGSLAAGLPDREDAPDQVAHWLFAFDAAAIASYRALALLTSLSPGAWAAREEAATREGLDLPMLRATVQESVRLWPTTFVVVRESTGPIAWESAEFEAGTGFLIFSSFFHRDSSRLSYADSFEPEAWLDGRAAADPGLVPFSAGPAVCPAQDVVRLATSLFLRALLREGTPRRTDASPLPASGLPASLDHLALKFTIDGGKS